MRKPWSGPGRSGDSAGTMNISLPAEMADEVERVVAERGYASRSELVREALRNFLAEERWRLELKGEFLAVITVTYDADHRGINDRINRVQHRYEEIILTTLHNHMKEKCLVAIFVKGGGERIRELVAGLEVLGGVERVRVATA